jgi:hypothetical protein
VQAFVAVVRARGRLYHIHQFTTHADPLLDEAVEHVRRAGHADRADNVGTDPLGRNVLGRWTPQVAEECERFNAIESVVRQRLRGDRRRVLGRAEGAARRAKGHSAHRAEPASPATRTLKASPVAAS